MTDAGDPLPGRELIQFITFALIFVTVVVQGLTLPWLIHKVGLVGDEDEEEREELRARLTIARAALDKVDAGPENALLIGDTVWDVEAAHRAGVETLAVLTGGFSEAELQEAGAKEVFISVEELRKRLRETPLRS